EEDLQLPGRVVHFRRETIVVGAGVGEVEEEGDCDDEGDEEDGSRAGLTGNAALGPLGGQGGGGGGVGDTVVLERKRVYRAVWSESDCFRDLVISSTMVSEHMPHILGNILRRSLRNTEEGGAGCGGGEDGVVADVDFR
ncbi:hypothetical protein HDU98_006015, partial [Podochytrium sp. JEL0797]